LRTHFVAPALLIGHSLGGAAVLAAAHRVPEAAAVVTTAAASDVAHVLQHFHGDLAHIERDGAASVTLGGRTFQIRKEFINDAKAQALKDRIGNLHKALLVMHAPADQIVGIEHATATFTAARHPKSFVSLDTADHLLTDRHDAAYAAEVIAAWASRFLPEGRAEAAAPHDGVVVAETGAGKFQNSVTAGRHRRLADEPTSVGGLGSGPNPYDYLAIALGACTSMTLRLYAEHKQLPLGRLTVDRGGDDNASGRACVDPAWALPADASKRTRAHWRRTSIRRRILAKRSRAGTDSLTARVSPARSQRTS
jgi:putative redox protein